MKNKEANKCLFCYDTLADRESDYHRTCSKKFFGDPTPPELPYTIGQINELAEKIVRSQIAVTGVQPKLSLHLEKKRHSPKSDKGSGGIRNRLTIVGLWGEYIFKPQTDEYPELPEIEDLTMHLTEIVGIKTVPHSLIRFKSGELAYITRRVDRVGKNGTKVHMEDMCQLTERLTEHKYHGSMEQVGNAVLSYSSNPGIDVINLFEITIFSFLVGNADMHLKNVSLIETKIEGEDFISLAPAYDLVATKLLIPGDKEQMALQMNGRNSNLSIGDFNKFATYLKINEKAKEASIDRFTESILPMEEFINRSFLSETMKDGYRKLLRERAIMLKML